MAKANGVRCNGHVVKRDDDNVLKRALILEVNGQRKRGRPKQTWRRRVEKSVKKNGLEVEKAANFTRRREGVRTIAEGMSRIRPPSITMNTPDQNCMMVMMKSRDSGARNRKKSLRG